MKTSETGVADALRVITEHPEGISAVEVAKLIGLRIDATLNKLRILRSRELAGVSIAGGRRALWMPPENAAVARLTYAQEQRSRAAAAQKRRNIARRRMALEDVANTDCDPPIVKRIIPANSAIPLLCDAPRWVFDVARYV